MKRLLAVGLMTASASMVHAKLPYGPTDAELRALPSFCTVRLRQETHKEQIKAMNAKFGINTWLHMHHYCLGLNWVNRARGSSDSLTRERALGNAKADYEYVIRNAAADFWMRPQMYVELGRVYVQTRDTVKAGRLFREAISFNASYEPAYLALIEIHRQSGSKVAALDAATAGLQQVPDSERLQRAYLEFGGKKPFPEPIVAAVPEPKPSQEQGAPDAAASGPLPNQSEAARDDVAVSASAPRASSEQEVIPERGCRFCPPEEIQRKWRESFGNAPTQ